MRRWLILIPLILLLATLALTVRAWLPPPLAFVGANTDLIQGVAAAVQIVLWLGAPTVALVSYLTGRRKPASPPAPQEARLDRIAPDVNQASSGNGVQAGGDVNVDGDLVMGDRIGRQINTGGGAYIGGNVNTGGGDFVGRDRSP